MASRSERRLERGAARNERSAIEKRSRELGGERPRSEHVARRANVPCWRRKAGDLLVFGSVKPRARSESSERGPRSKEREHVRREAEIPKGDLRSSYVNADRRKVESQHRTEQREAEKATRARARRTNVHERRKVVDGSTRWTRSRHDDRGECAKRNSFSFRARNRSTRIDEAPKRATANEPPREEYRAEGPVHRKVRRPAAKELQTDVRHANGARTETRNGQR